MLLQYQKDAIHDALKLEEYGRIFNHMWYLWRHYDHNAYSKIHE